MKAQRETQCEEGKAAALGALECGGKEVGAILGVNIITIDIRIITIIIIIIITRPMPPYGRQGLAGSWGMDTVRRVHFGVFSTSQPTSFDPKNVTSQTRGPNRPFRCLDYFRAIVTPVAQFFRKK